MSIAPARSSIQHGAAALVATAALLVAGCGASGRSPAAGGGLSTALHAVSDTPAARQYFEWGDVRTERQLVGVPRTALQPATHLNIHWQRILGVGATQIASVASVVASRLKLDLYRADEAITIGEPPTTAVRLDGPGIDGASVADALRRAGAKQHGGLLTMPSGSTNRLYANGTPPFPPGLVNHASASGHTVAIGQTQAAVSAILGGGSTLGEQQPYQAAANCLGDVVWAAIAPPRTFGMQAGPELIAIGGRRPAAASSPPVEVLCAIDSGSALANGHERALRRMLGPSGLLPTTNEPTGAVVAASAVSRADSSGLQVVRAVLTLRSKQPAGFLLQASNNRDLALFLATTCPGPQILRRVTPQQIAELCRRLGLP